MQRNGLCHPIAETVAQKVCPIASQCWCRDRRQVKPAVYQGIRGVLGCAGLIPGNKVAKITQIIADRSGSQVLLFAEGLFILRQCLLSSSREWRIRLPLHRYLMREKDRSRNT